MLGFLPHAVGEYAATTLVATGVGYPAGTVSFAGSAFVASSGGGGWIGAEYVGPGSTDAISLYRPGSSAARHSYVLGSTVSPDGIAITPDGRFLYVFADGQMLPIRLQ